MNISKYQCEWFRDWPRLSSVFLDIMHAINLIINLTHELIRLKISVQIQHRSQRVRTPVPQEYGTPEWGTTFVGQPKWNRGSGHKGKRFDPNPSFNRLEFMMD